MKLKTARPKTSTVRAKCRICHRVIAAGDSVLHEYFPNNPYGDRDVFWHAVCMRAVLDGEPANETLRRHRGEKVLAAMRETIVEEMRELLA